MNIRNLLRLLSRMGLGKFQRLRQVGERVYALRPEVAEVHGHKMILDSSDSLGLSSKNRYEPLQTRLVIDKIKPGDVAVDVGANIGYYTLLFAKLAGETGKVFAFEPEPRNFSLLTRNIKLNGYKNVVAIQKALSNKTGMIKLYLCPSNKGRHSIHKTPDHRGYLEVEAIRLDDYFKDFQGKIGFIKMDAEGSEPLALQGMTQLIQRNECLMLCAEFAADLQPFGMDLPAYLELLESFEFKLYDIDEDQGILQPVTRAALLEKYAAGDSQTTNLFCVRENR